MTTALRFATASGVNIINLPTVGGITYDFPATTSTLIGNSTVDTLTNKTLTAPVISTISNVGILTLPTTTDTIVGRATIDTLINKTLTAPVISTISNTGVLTLPTSTDTIIGRATIDTLINKTLTSPIINGGTLNGNTIFQVTSGSTTGVIVQNSQRFLHTYGTDNFFIGPLAGNFTLTGTQNTAVGNSTFFQLSTGTSNTLVGYLAGSLLTTGNTNTGLGNGALSGLLGGNNNIAIGNIAGTNYVVNESNNICIGSIGTPGDSGVIRIGTPATHTSAFILNMTVPTSTDTFVGRNTVDTLTNKTLTAPVISTISNTGTLTLPTSTDTIVARATIDTLVNKTLTAPSTTGTVGIAGVINLATTTSSTAGVINSNGSRFIHNYGTQNTFVGITTGNFTLSGTNNTCVGYNIFTNATTAAANSLMGASAGSALTTGANNVFIGVLAGNLLTTGSTNVSYGSSSLQNLLTGSNNVALGTSAGSAFTGAESNNICIGNFGTLGDSNITRIGTSGTQTQCYIAGTVNPLLNLNLAATSSTAGSITSNGSTWIHRFGTNCNFIGTTAGNFTLSGSFNQSVGDNTLTALTSGTRNVAFGLQSGKAITTGSNNIGLGCQSLLAVTTGGANVCVGDLGAFKLTTGNNNVVLGNGAAANLTTGSQNVIIGDSTAGAYTTSESNNIVIGYNLTTTIGESNTARIGNGSQTKCFINGIRGITTGSATGITTLIDTNGQLGTVSSSRILKENIADLDEVSIKNVIEQLNPVTFSYKSDSTHTMTYGLIAEDVKEILPEVVVKINPQENCSLLTVQYHLLPILMLKELKRLQKIVDDIPNKYVLK